MVDPDKVLGVFGSTRFGTINGHACHTITGTAVMILSGRRHDEQACERSSMPSRPSSGVCSRTPRRAFPATRSHV